MSSGDKAVTLGGRVEGSRIKMWLLVRPNRPVLAGGLSVLVFTVLVLLSTVSPAPMRRVIDSTDALWWVFSPMLTAIITAVALVVTFNQLVLSQELGALGDQRQRMQGAIDFRRDLEPSLSTDVAPSDPATFMWAILESIHRLAAELDGSVKEVDQAPARAVRALGTDLSENARTVASNLEGARFGTFEVIRHTLGFNYSAKLHRTRELLATDGDDLDVATTDRLEELETLLEFYGPAREHLKTMYFQWELINLSRAMLYASVPALVVALSMLLYVDTVGVTGATLGVDNVVWLVCAAVTITLTPFFLLVSYVLRIATVAKRTLAIGPFVLRSTDPPDDFTIE